MTAPRIGFVLLSFNLPEQTIFLCRRLTELFGAPPISLHHDFGQCALSVEALPENVHVVRPSISTSWGRFPVVEANLAALRLLYERSDPDWVVSVSTADYPVRSPENILGDLAAAPWDGFLDHRELRPIQLAKDHVRDESLNFHDPAWLQVAYARYVATDLTPARLTWRFPRLHKPRLMRGALAERLFTPFTSSFRPYGGDAWYTLNRRAAQVLAEPTALSARLAQHYRTRRVPEESFYQTVLCNRADLRICPDSLRYTDWSRGGSGPRFLTREDVPTLTASGAHFARKFRFDTELFEELDRRAPAEPAGAGRRACFHDAADQGLRTPSATF